MQAQDSRILFVTHSAGFRHGSIETARRVLAGMQGLQVTATEDLSFIRAPRLAGFDAVFFFTSGELALDAEQKRDLIEFVRAGKGFGGVHSATDTLYLWEDYGELIGGYFDGHPWTEPVTVRVDAPAHVTNFHLAASSFRILEEIYQFRAWDRSKVRVVLSLDPDSVDLSRPGVNRTDRDFALAWTRQFGAGRVYYNALGHFDETWLDPRFQRMIQGALVWLAQGKIADIPVLAPGALIDIPGSGLANAPAVEHAAPWPTESGGSQVTVNGAAAAIFRAAPQRLTVQIPYGLRLTGPANLAIQSAGSTLVWPAPVQAAAPVLVGRQAAGDVLVLYATGLGEVSPPVAAGTPAPAEPLSRTVSAHRVTVGGVSAEVLFSGLVPGIPALYQINIRRPEGTAADAPVEIVQ